MIVCEGMVKEGLVMVEVDMLLVGLFVLNFVGLLVKKEVLMEC